MEDQIIVTSYAPVFIPTLCRYEHFIKLLDSLEKCTWSEYTEVYVSLDYPPSEKYVEGHRQIDNYLKNKEEKNRFKQLHVFRQEANLGIGGNFLFLRHYFNKYDRYIITEDDNVFSPNFLVFMNKGLEAFKEDPSVYSICGYRYFYNLLFENNNFFRQNVDFNAWGCGFWKHKYLDSCKCNSNYLKRILFNPFKLIKIWRISTVRLNNLIYFSQKSHFVRNDIFKSLYLINENMYQIMPRISKVRNMGWDGTGINCIEFDNDIKSMHMNQSIDDKDGFQYIGTGWEFCEENRKIIVKENFQQVNSFKVFLKLIVRILLFWR